MGRWATGARTRVRSAEARKSPAAAENHRHRFLTVDVTRVTAHNSDTTQPHPPRWSVPRWVAPPWKTRSGCKTFSFVERAFERKPQSSFLRGWKLRSVIVRVRGGGRPPPTHLCDSGIPPAAVTRRDDGVPPRRSLRTTLTRLSASSFSLLGSNLPPPSTPQPVGSAPGFFSCTWSALVSSDETRRVLSGFSNTVSSGILTNGS